MKNSVFRLYILVLFLFTAGVFAFADQSSLPSDDKSTPVSDEQTNFFNDLNKIIDQSRENINNVNAKIKEQEILKRNQKRLERAREYYEKGLELTKEGKLVEARDYFQKTIRITQNSEIAKYIKECQLQLKKEEEIASAYKEAVSLYNQKEFQAAKDGFEKINKIVPGYQSTKNYLSNIDQEIATEAAMVAKQKADEILRQQKEAEEAQAKEKQRVLAEIIRKEKIRKESIEEQAKDVAALAEKSAELYHLISDVADDTTTVQTKQKMAQVDEILRNLKESKERVMRQAQEEQWRQQQEEVKAKQAQRKADIEKFYHDGLEYLRSHEYAKAKINFMALENLSPDYKKTRRYLNQADEALKKANVEAVTSHEKAEAQHLRQLQEIEDAKELRLAQEAQEKERILEEQQQASLKELSQKAANINDDIIRLSQDQDYDGMKAKFVELEKTVTAITTLKDEMAKGKYHLEAQKKLALETKAQVKERVKVQRKEDQQIHAYYRAQTLSEYRPILSTQPNDADHYKREEIMQEQNVLFNEGVDRYEHGKYSQAKLLFGELADQHDRRAEVWLKKVDRAITRELLRSQEGEERERTEFIADQIRAQRELMVIQERERLRQKRLTEELELQKRFYEDDRLLQLRKEEIIKAQERERQRQEEKRLQIENEKEKQQEMFHFHKIKIVIKPQPVEKPKVKINPPVQPVVARQVVKPVVAQPVANVSQIKADSQADARQKHVEERQKEQERQQELIAKQREERQARIKAREDARQKRIEERQARIKAREEARQKRIEERQKEKERQQELIAKQQQERQARLKAQADARAQILQAQKEKLVQEQKRREELLRQQEEQRQENMKQEEIIREENQRRQELEMQEHQRQAQLEAQREAIRKQLENGVEAMYQEALSLYKQGEYAAAADRFKDVQDILPGYKRSEQYMDQARSKSLEMKSDPPLESTNGSAQSVTAVASPSVSHQDNVSKALDLFDPNAK